MSAADFADLSRYALEHPFVGNWTGGQQRAGEVAMMHSWAHCNNNGFYRVCASSDIRFLCEPFLKRVREAGANAFVLKLFAGYASDYANAPSFFSSSLPLQGEDGPKIDDRYNRWVPKTVSILDLQVGRHAMSCGVLILTALLLRIESHLPGPVPGARGSARGAAAGLRKHQRPRAALVLRQRRRPSARGTAVAQHTPYVAWRHLLHIHRPLSRWSGARCVD